MNAGIVARNHKRDLEECADLRSQFVLHELEMRLARHYEELGSQIPRAGHI